MYITTDGKTAAEENGGTMDDRACTAAGVLYRIDGERYLYTKTMGKITEACKTSEKIEGRRRRRRGKKSERHATATSRRR